MILPLVSIHLLRSNIFYTLQATIPRLVCGPFMAAMIETTGYYTMFDDTAPHLHSFLL